jgi:dipeptidyl aminopeptidase/acylaminoacyl peptidase
VTIPVRYAPRRAQIPYWLILATVLAAVVAVMPIVAAIFGNVGAPGSPKTAFATAPAGTYVVVARAERDYDIISVAPVGDPGAVSEIARVPHLPGYPSNGAVSPDGRRLALVTTDAGSVARPGASLLVVELETGAITRLAVDVDPLQTPLWAPAGDAVIATRIASDDRGQSTVSFLRVPLDLSGEQQVKQVSGVLGAYAVGFDPSGRFVSVVIDSRGSTVLRDGGEVALLSTQITRDWRLSPDGTQLAFIESDVTNGLHYRAGVASLAGPSSGGAVLAQALSTETQQLGVAWKPGAASPTFGGEPAAQPGVTAQALVAGFDVPISYSPDGAALAEQHWTGSSFAEPGRLTLAVETASGRISLDGYTRFFGWASR